MSSFLLQKVWSLCDFAVRLEVHIWYNFKTISEDPCMEKEEFLATESHRIINNVTVYSIIAANIWKLETVIIFVRNATYG